MWFRLKASFSLSMACSNCTRFSLFIASLNVRGLFREMLVETWRAEGLYLSEAVLMRELWREEVTTGVTSGTFSSLSSDL